MEDKENIYVIPANFTDSGKIFGGLVSVRNAIETLVLLLVFGFTELKLIPMEETVKIIVMAITLIPMSIFSLVGIDGDSLFQYLGHIFSFALRRRKLSYKVGYYE